MQQFPLSLQAQCSPGELHGPFVNFDATIAPDWNDCAVLVTGFPLSIVTPHVRKHLSADALFHVVRSGFADIPDPRCADVDIALTDTRMSAFAMFSLTAPSLLAFDQERAEGHGHTIDGIARVPCDPYLRARLAPRSPKWLRPVCKSVCRQRQRGQALDERRFREGHDLLALAGTGYFSSPTMHGASGVHTVHRHGAVT
jgi:hypothetical protein